jgi:hypothetical protein
LTSLARKGWGTRQARPPSEAGKTALMKTRHKHGAKNQNQIIFYARCFGLVRGNKKVQT